ncbi:thiamine phosphate synthase [Zongyangia hominis]|uniref:Thiamine-phosphate synthase n=1 Tax=Zongyangia hominis TaxID=2763677 RepID=A0A926EBP8_9FIRM|nr:thiamine phosphate synthase [Zongyangia hominis]MBC8570853.1 thiamine phosphate synthase [Zongyangia hominis]
MRIARETMRLYLVTDRTWLAGRTLEFQVEEAIRGGVTLVQLREKHASEAEFLALARQVKEVTDRYGVPLIINDSVEIALAVDAAGVHLGQEDGDIRLARERLGDSKIIGVSAHNEDEAIAAYAEGADYLGSGAAFGSSTKGDAGKISLDTLGRVARSVSIPVVAIGGIDEDNALELRGRKLSGIAVVSAILDRPDARAAAERMRALADQIAE